jgi:DDE superfamily endonuclease
VIRISYGKEKITTTGRINKQLQRIENARDLGFPVCESFYTSNYYTVQENAWMESKLVVECLEKVYQPWAREKGKPRILILDEFTGHMTSVGGHLILIPSGYTWKLQEKDISLNKPFKNKIRDIYNDWGYTHDMTIMQNPNKKMWRTG